MDLNNQEFSFLINLIMRKMGMDTEDGIECNTHFVTAPGWGVSWSEHDVSFVFIDFYPNMDPNGAADTARRFWRIMDLLDIRVMMEHDPDDCDSSTTTESMVKTQ